MTSGKKWYCQAPPRRTSAAWCDDLPCPGHRVRKPLAAAAEVIGWMDGYEDPQSLAPDLWADYLTHAAEALAAIGHEVRP